MLRHRSLGVALMAAMIAARSSHGAAVDWSYFAWKSAPAGTFTAEAGGISGSLVFSTAQDDHLFRKDAIGTHRHFAAKYGNLVPAVKFDSGPPNSGSGALAVAQVVLSSPLPAGSRLLVFDLDVGNRDERMQVTQFGGALSLVEQLESSGGETSTFPIWLPDEGVLLAQGRRATFEAATVFDASGAHGFAFTYFSGAVAGPGLTGASFAIGAPIPEPASAVLMAAGGALLAIAVGTQLRVR